jgi:hypothetical protein
MKAIWKFPLAPADIQDVPMPPGAEILSVAVQKGSVCLWAQVVPAEMKESRRVAMIGTGIPIYEHDLPASAKFIGTVLLNDGSLVLHVFDLGVR